MQGGRSRRSAKTIEGSGDRWRSAGNNRQYRGGGRRARSTDVMSGMNGKEEGVWRWARGP